KRAYAKLGIEEFSQLDAMKFNIDLFDRQVKFRLGEDLRKETRNLHLAKEAFELDHRHMVEEFKQKRALPAEFIKSFNKMTLKFQDDVATALNKVQYKKLLDLDRDEKIVLADPDIIKSLYGEATVKAVYGKL
ncbi:MAG: hypothetical protein WC825_11400, partial [Gallionellaceae bacterium]